MTCAGREDSVDHTGALGPGLEKCHQPERGDEPVKEAEMKEQMVHEGPDEFMSRWVNCV